MKIEFDDDIINGAVICASIIAALILTLKGCALESKHIIEKERMKIESNQ